MSNFALSKVLLGSAVLAALTFGFAGCSDDEDENDALDGYSISLTNDGTCTNSAGNTVKFARQWNVTHTKHLSADATITIDRKTQSTQVGKVKNATTGNATTTTDGGNNAAYMFGLLGSGTTANPYSFYLVGFRLYGTTPQYFISYYTGVIEDYINSDINDFDDASNSAYEYEIVEAWSNLDSSAYAITEDALTVFIDLDAIYGDDNTVVTSDNYSVAKNAGIDGYRIVLKPSKDSTETGFTKNIHLSDLTLATSVSTSESYTTEKQNNAPLASATALTVDQADIGFYAMVSKDKTLVAHLDFDNDSFVKSAYAGPVDDFGKVIDLNGEVLKNF